MPRTSGSRSTGSRTVRKDVLPHLFPSLELLENRATISDTFLSALVVPGLSAAALQHVLSPAPPPYFNYLSRVGDPHATLSPETRLLAVDRAGPAGSASESLSSAGFRFLVSEALMQGQPSWLDLDWGLFGAAGDGVAALRPHGDRSAASAGAEGAASGAQSGLGGAADAFDTLSRGIVVFNDFRDESTQPLFTRSVYEPWLEQALVVTLNSRFAQAGVWQSGIFPPGGDPAGPGGGNGNSTCAVPPETPPCDDGSCRLKNRDVGGTGGGAGDQLGINPRLGDKNAFRRDFSDPRVRYATGMLWTYNPYLPGPGGDGPQGPGGPGGPGGPRGPRGPGDGFGTPWEVAGYWTNLDCSATSVGPGGPAFGQSELPYLRRVNVTPPPGNDEGIYVISSGLNVRKFSNPVPTVDPDVKSYQTGPFYLHNQEVFAHNTNPAFQEFILTTTTGTQWRFHDFDVTDVNKRGELKSFRDAYGNEITTTFANNVLTVVRGGPPVAGRATEQFVYMYQANGSLEQVVQQRTTTGGAPWITVRQVDYTYYSGGSSHGPDGTLKQVDIKDPNLQVLDTYYFRYYTSDGTAGGREGYSGGLKFVFQPESYARLKTAFPNPDDATDTAAKPFADTDVQYYAPNPQDPQNDRKVKEITVQGQGCSVCSGGQGRFQYSYTQSNNPDNVNKWKSRTVETLPDDTVNIVYANYAGQVMLKDHGAASGTGDRWVHFWKYGDHTYDNGQVVLHALPSAIQKDGAGKYYDDSKADLLDLQQPGNNYLYLKDNAGLIEAATFAASTSGTISDTVAGDVEGYLKDTRLKNGESGTEVVQSRTKYFKVVANGASFNGLTIYPVAQETVYRDATSNPDSGGAPQHTNYSYQWYADGANKKPGIDTLTVTYPSVSAAQNGPAASEVQTTKFNTYGWPVWSKDGEGYLNYAQYDRATGAAIRTIADAPTTVTGDPEYGTSPWTAPPGTRLQLTTQSEVDALGRTTKLIDPKGNCSYAVYNDLNHEARTYPGWYVAGGACEGAGITTGNTTGPIQVWREDRQYSPSYVETLTISRASIPATNGRPNGSETIASSTLQTLARTLTSAGGQVIEVNAYHNLSGLSYGTQTVLSGAAENINYYKTVYGYDSRGRQNRVKLPTGTVYRTIFDGLNRSIRSWVGTDEGANWSEAAPGDLRIVAASVYDGTDSQGGTGGVGDSNLTQQITYPTPKLQPGDPEPADRRVTRHWYDWRNRQIASKQGVQSTEADTVNRPLVASTFNNLGQVVMREQYDGDTLTSPPTVTSTDCYAGRTYGSETNLTRRRACVNTDYDERGRVYRTRTFYVYQETEANPGTSPVRAPLQADTWYSLRGQVLKSSAPGGLVQKTQYDGAGRTLKQYASDGGGDSGWSDADDVTGDYVLEQVETQYDANSLPQLLTRRRRFHDETATGELANKDTAPKARVSYVAKFYDRADRSTAVVDVGTNGGDSYPWDFTTVPARSDNVLVTDYQYHAAGWLERVTDPKALVRKTTYDNLGRATRVVENYTDGTPTTTTNRTTDFSYDGNGHKLTHKAVLPAGGKQTTQYSYQARTTDGHDVNSNDLLVFVNHPDKMTGEPSWDPANTEFFMYNGVGQQKKARYDRNGTVHAYTFDVVGRLTADAIDAVGTGVDDAVRRLEISYNDAGQRYRFTSYSAATGGTLLNQVEQRFNGFGQLLSEAQEHGGAVVSGTPKVEYGYSYDPSQPTGPNHSRPATFIYPLSTPYPSGRTFTYGYNTGLDERVSRLSAITEGATTLEGYTYLGQSTVVERTHPQPNVNLTYIDPAGGSGSAGDKYIGLDRFDRIVDVHWRNPSTSTTTDRFGYGHDRNSNRLYRENLHPDQAAATFDELYHLNGVNQGYDGFNQLLAFARGTLNETKDTIASPTRSQKWTNAQDQSTFDALGNWTSVNTDGTTQTREHNAQNQITSISTPDVTPAYDNNGNTTKDEKGRGLVYDAWNRLVEIKTAPTGTRLVRYTYDALGRRVCETTGGQSGENLCVATGGTRRDFYYSANWQVVEERYNGAVQAHYVWSPVYVDAMILRDRDTGGSSDLDERLYVQQDANFNVTAVVSSAGSVTERYVYDPYGKPTFLSAAWATLGGSGVAWRYLHQGGRYHDFGDGTGLYHFRNRDLSSSLGRWIRMDPIGFAGGDNNLYRYVGNSPVRHLDPLGLLVDVATEAATGWSILSLLKGLSLGTGAIIALPIAIAAGEILVIKYDPAAEAVAEAVGWVEPFRPPYFPRTRCEKERKKCEDEYDTCFLAAADALGACLERYKDLLPPDQAFGRCVIETKYDERQERCDARREKCMGEAVDTALQAITQGIDDRIRRGGPPRPEVVFPDGPSVDPSTLNVGVASYY